MKKYVLNAIIGMGFGFPITLLCMILVGGYNPVMKEFLVWMAASALYGVLSTVMDSKKFDMPLPASIGLHALGCIVITMGAALLCGYVKSIADVLPILIPALVIYIVVCLICFLLMKQNEKQINKALEEK
jgi:uncharacterized membrane protein YesL